MKRDIVAFACCTTLMLGCKVVETNRPTDSRIVGTWTVDDRGMAGLSVEFKADGTVRITGTPVGMKEVTEDGEATYRLDGATLTIEPGSMKMRALDSADPQTKRAVDEANKMGNAPDPHTLEVDTITWQDNNAFSTKDSHGGVVVFRRKV